VRLDFDFQAFASRVVHHVIKARQLGCIERSEFAVLEPLPQERQPDYAQAFGRVVVDLGMGRIGVVDAKRSGDIGAELGAGEIDADQERTSHDVSRTAHRRIDGSGSRRPTPIVTKVFCRCQEEMSIDCGLFRIASHI